MARPITGTVYKPDGTPWASGEVRARLMEPFETSTRVYPKTEITITLETDGTIPAGTQLDTPDSGTAHYLITTPDQAHYEVYISTGTAVDLVTLLTIAGTAVDPDDLQTLLDAAELFSVASYTTTCNILAADEYIEIPSGTFTATLPAAAVVGDNKIVDNYGTGTITLAAAAGETINGAASITIYSGATWGIICNAVGSWRAVGGG